MHHHFLEINNQLGNITRFDTHMNSSRQFPSARVGNSSELNRICVSFAFCGTDPCMHAHCEKILEFYSRLAKLYFCMHACKEMANVC